MDEFEKWPVEQREAMARVAAGLAEGDLLPLADYFRAGFREIEPAIARELADMIGGGDNYMPYRIDVVARTRGHLGWAKSWEFHDRKMQVGVFMEDKVRTYGRGGYEAALADTKEHFDIKSSATVTKSLTYLRKQMRNAQCAPGWDHWAYLKDRYLTPNT